MDINIYISGEPKEIADLAAKMQSRQREQSISFQNAVAGAFRVVLGKLCDEFSLNDDETAKALSALVKETKGADE